METLVRYMWALIRPSPSLTSFSSNNLIIRGSADSIFNRGMSMSTDTDFAVTSRGSSEAMQKFVGKFHKISGNEGHTLEMSLQNEGGSLRIFLKLSNEDQGHFRYFDEKNTNKIHIRHSFGFATFTMDDSQNHLMEENHTDGKNWMWESEQPEHPSLFNSTQSGTQCTQHIYIRP